MNASSYIKANELKTTFVVIIASLLLFLVLYFLGNYFLGGGYFWFAMIFSLTSILSSYFFADKLVLKMSKAIPLEEKIYPQVYTSVKKIAKLASIEMPKLYFIDSDALNAFATGRNPQNASVALTRGIIEKLNKSELEGVLAHELSHVKNRDILLSTVVAVIVGGLMMLIDYSARMRLWRDDDRSASPFSLIFALVGVILVPLLSSLIQMSLSRQREYLADATGALLLGDALGLASALSVLKQDHNVLKSASSSTAHLFISDPFGSKRLWGSVVANWFSTHPPLDKRIQILEKLQFTK